MHTGKRYRVIEVLLWTKRETLVMSLIAVLPIVLSVGLGWVWLQVPWVPVAMLGSASAFTVGFRNNATYNRTWEARQIWGRIVNASRAWGIMVRDMLVGGATPDDADTTRLVHRHIAWLTALRYQLREPRPWENMDRADNREFRERYFTVAESDGALNSELARLLGPDESARVLAASNRATAILALQSEHLHTLARDGVLDSIRHVAFVRQLAELYDHQGRSERIKGFPYPRQFATLNYWFIRLFVCLVPFGMLNEFRRFEDGALWLTVPFSVVVTWIFLALEKVGESTENPFEGSANDVPITAISRTIEIDLREMLGESDIPKPLAPMHAILM
jgi:ion channel-forming bestrophin family protein